MSSIYKVNRRNTSGMCFCGSSMRKYVYLLFEFADKDIPEIKAGAVVLKTNES